MTISNTFGGTVIKTVFDTINENCFYEIHCAGHREFSPAVWAQTRWPITVGATAIAILPLLAATLIGSNHPALWLFWSAAISAIACGFVLAAPRLSATILRRYWLPLSAGLLVAAFSGVQIAVNSIAISAVPGTILPTNMARWMPATLALPISFLAALRVLGYVIYLALVLAFATAPGRAAAMARILFFGVVAHAAWGLLALRFWNDTLFGRTRAAYGDMANGTFVNHNSFATFFGMGLSLGLSILGADPDN